MENYKHFDRISKDILKECMIDKKTSNEKMEQMISLWLEMTLFKIISLLYIHVAQQNKKTISKETWSDVTKMFSFKCNMNMKSGGRLGSATYMGINEASYATDAGSDVLYVDFQTSDHVRPAIGSPHGAQYGGASKPNKVHKAISKAIGNILRYFNIRMNSDVKVLIINTMVAEIKCLKHCLQNTKVLNITNLKKVLKHHNLIQ